MRQEGVYMVNMEHETLLNEVLSEEMVRLLMAEWKNEWGEQLDFGGGVKDVPVYAVLDLCDGSANRLRKFFPFLSVSDASSLLATLKAAS